MSRAGPRDEGVLLRHGTVIDGDGPPRRADVLVVDRRIVGVDEPGTLRGDVPEVDCRDLLVVPGFIDAHSHADYTLPTNPGAQVLHRQGVTTLVTGNCGYSAFTYAGAARDEPLPGAFLNPALHQAWAGVRDFARDLEGRGLGVNVVPLVGHSSVRSRVLGPGGGVAESPQVRDIVAAVASALRDGAAGVSLGLAYQEGRDAALTELLDVARLSAAADKVLAVHVRDERAGCPEAVDELVTVARATGTRLHISHLKAMGRAQWGGTRQTLAQVDEAIGEGLDVSVDMYPYQAGATGLANALPTWALHGGDPGLRALLADPTGRGRLTAELAAGAGYIALDEIVFSALSQRWRSWQGRSLTDVAREERADPATVLLDVLATEGDTASMLVRAMAADDVDRVLAHPSAIVGSDGWILEPAPGAHPRNFATFVRTLVRAEDDDALVDAVRRQTSAVADRFRIADRGRIRPGQWADLAVLDPTALDEGGGYARPELPPGGVVHVYVNGTRVYPAAAEGAATGRVLLHPDRSS